MWNACLIFVTIVYGNSHSKKAPQRDSWVLLPDARLLFLLSFRLLAMRCCSPDLASFLSLLPCVKADAKGVLGWESMCCFLFLGNISRLPSDLVLQCCRGFFFCQRTLFLCGNFPYLRIYTPAFSSSLSRGAGGRWQSHLSDWDAGKKRKFKHKFVSPIYKYYSRYVANDLNLIPLWNSWTIGGSRTPTKRNSTKKLFFLSPPSHHSGKKKNSKTRYFLLSLFSPDRTHSTFPLLPVIDMNGLAERKGGRRNRVFSLFLGEEKAYPFFLFMI